MCAIASVEIDRKSTRLNSSHVEISYAVFCLKKKKNHIRTRYIQLHTNNEKPRRNNVFFSERGLRALVAYVASLEGPLILYSLFFFFFNDTATTEIYTLSLHDALPI